MWKKYNHWFWNGSFVRYIAKKVCRLDSWLWTKRYKRKS